MRVISEREQFPGHDGNQLAARFDRPEVGEPQAVAIFAHCFTCTKDILAAKRIAARLVSRGVAVLRFDFTGLGHSEGEFANTHFSSNVDDLVAAAKHLEGRGLSPSLLVGHSLGGAAVIAAAERLPGVKAVATVGAPYDPAHVVHNFGSNLDVIEREGEAELVLAGRPFTIRKAFIEDLQSQRQHERIENLGRPLLVLHAPNDETVEIENASAIFTAARHPRSFVSLDDADHLLTRPQDAEYAAEVIVGWASRYLGLEAPKPPAGAPEGVTRVSEADPAGFRQDVVAGAHHLQADEPLSYGGTNLGFTPYQLLAAALGSCTAMTVRSYARRKKLPLDDVTVDVSHDKIHAKDCGECEATSGKIDHFERVLFLTGDLDQEARDKLLAIADLCPVHLTLEGKARVVTRLAD
ncbi:bifunctional alpha/beta hydrolase/OsmC family protein [Halomonas sp. OfavH-34-E]|uniref:bifunctional alpha/beta hydrolase/OsmC family protein n=1 Tax=Halomonas sp. OfavH-34-E TaxID=2954491 RepID=UPI0020979F42|nr:bifunctional alpha/beta hydrolase/OsmC family protein [Halomonas sp. OfavH-34-E]MCO7213632.1 bifunctional alpha/beta hydrolase/OsmC family protein [Halomonas sp. OfavH-34-E]